MCADMLSSSVATTCTALRRKVHPSKSRRAASGHNWSTSPKMGRSWSEFDDAQADSDGNGWTPKLCSTSGHLVDVNRATICKLRTKLAGMRPAFPRICCGPRSARIMTRPGVHIGVSQVCARVSVPALAQRKSSVSLHFPPPPLMAGWRTHRNVHQFTTLPLSACACMARAPTHRRALGAKASVRGKRSAVFKNNANRRLSIEERPDARGSSERNKWCSMTAEAACFLMWDAIPPSVLMDTEARRRPSQRRRCPSVGACWLSRQAERLVRSALLRRPRREVATWQGDRGLVRQLRVGKVADHVFVRRPTGNPLYCNSCRQIMLHC